MELESEDGLPLSAAVSIVSDRAMIREMLVEAVETMGIQVLEAVSTAADVNNSDENCVFLMQVPSVRDPAFAGLSTLADKHPNSRILVFCDVGEYEELQSNVPPQVYAIITDEFSTEILVSAIRLVNAGLNITSPNVKEPPASTHSEQSAAPTFNSSDPTLLSLTKREIAVLSRLKSGLENKVIANELGVSEATIKVHLRGLYRKTGAKNRTQAALWAARRL